MEFTSGNIEDLFKSFSAKENEAEKILQSASASSIARLLYLKKLVGENHPDAERVKQETAFFTGNIPWYEFVISYLGDKAELPPEEKESVGQTDSGEVNGQSGSRMYFDSEIANETETSAGADISPSDNSDKPEPSDSGESEAVDSAALHFDSPGDSMDGDRTVEKPENTEEQPDETLFAETDIREQEVLNDAGAEQEITGIQGSEAVESGPLIPLEPLHTVDYFASQGIKISEEDLQDDELSRQVKSFTGWLKSMKRLHGNPPEQDDAVERIIRNAAEASNRKSGVLTEAMAEILVKQNKKEEAIELYEKLSLKNPSKSAYFAAKIENLKTI